jgi:Replication-relaxation
MIAPELRTPLKQRSRSPQLGKRDGEIIEWFRHIRFAETRSFAAAYVPSVFPTQRVLRRRLSKLAEMGFLDRPARRITKEREQEFVLADDTRERGRPQDIWALAQRGARVLELDQRDWNRDNGRLRHSSFAHPLMVTEVYTTIRMAAAQGIIGLESWSGENRWHGQIELDGQKLPIVPDSVIALRVPATGREVLIFLECDLSTEPLRRSAFEQSSFYKKVLAYRAYWLRDFYPENTPMLVWTVAKTPARAASLREVVESVDAERLGQNLFWFTHGGAWDVKRPESFLSAPIWTTAGGREVSFL